ncbi:hypothetical protein AB0C12_09240 [Actinoplanes sp. NPDC048967]|uniref:hypothetical protein n=1 Tax=Actinoplanes sp. NPDC048967 TaxID=3155269 RepID=UPI0033CCBF0C
MSDGGGVVAAARRPIVAARRVAPLLASLAEVAGDFTVRPIWLNGAPAMRLDLGDELDTAVSLVLDGGRITGIYAVRNPDKLARLGAEARLSR